MLYKEPKPKFKRFLGTAVKTVFIAEALAFGVSYGIWYKLNTNRDFRLYMYQNHNWALEGFYSIGEYVSDLKTRDLDQKVWTNEGKI